MYVCVMSSQKSGNLDACLDACSITVKGFRSGLIIRIMGVVITEWNNLYSRGPSKTSCLKAYDFWYHDSDINIS